MNLKNCPFCGKDTIFEEGYLWNDNNVVRCGCETIGCMGYYKDCLNYLDYKQMAKKWNTRHILTN